MGKSSTEIKILRLKIGEKCSPYVTEKMKKYGSKTSAKKCLGWDYTKLKGFVQQRKPPTKQRDNRLGGDTR